MNAFQKLSTPIGRVLLALMFVTSGVGKIFSYSGTQGYMDAMGVPGMLLPAVIVLEALGGLAIMLGWQTRITAFLLAGFCIVSAILFHADFSDKMQMIMFMKNISIAGGFMLLVAHGAGAYSFDNRGK